MTSKLDHSAVKPANGSAQKSANNTYPIGTKGQPWGNKEREQWLERQRLKRSYRDDVLEQLNKLDEPLLLVNYGALSFDAQRYPLYAVRSQQFDSSKPTALITGGVHGYETSGVHGALRFVNTHACAYATRFNLIVAPCLSPWAYETINRWNPQAVDPNRSFYHDSPAQESTLLMNFVHDLSQLIAVHIDLHETTDTDNSEFRPALAARDNVEHEEWDIPDGFYLVGDSENPCHAFQSHIISAVQRVTHIAPADEGGRIIGEKTTQHGVINYPLKALNLCTGFSNAPFNTTTEVYPDSPRVDAENCIRAQVTAICAALDFVESQET